MRLNVIMTTVMLLSCILAGAQNSLPREYGGNRSTGLSTSGSRRSDIIGTKMDAKSLPMENNRYTDSKYEELQKEMEEKKWNTEDGAWQKASSIDTRDSYMRYIGMYPTGLHMGEASKRIVDKEVEDLMKNTHDALPGIRQVEEDYDSPTSTIVMENTTQYVLTVRYSGPESKVVSISPCSKASVTLANGSYKIAASVPPAHIKPFAGCQDFAGGRFETGYCIIYR